MTKLLKNTAPLLGKKIFFEILHFKYNQVIARKILIDLISNMTELS